MASASVSKTTKSYTYRSTGGGPAEVSIEYSADLSALSRLEDKIRLLQDDLESEREFRQRVEVNRRRDTELTKLRKLLEDVHLESEETANLLRKKHHEIVVDFQDQIDQLSKLKGKAEKEKARFQQEVYELLAQLESSNKEKLISIKQSEKLEITVRELSENIELVKEVQDLKVNIENATYLKSQLAGQLEDARRRLEDDERRRTTLEATLHQVEIELESVRVQLEEESEARLDLERQLTRANGEVATFRSKWETEAAARVEEVEDLRRKYTARIQEQEEHIESLVVKVNNLEKQKSRLQSEVEVLIIDLEKANNTARELQKRVESLERINIDIKTRLEETIALYEASQRDVRNKQTEIQRLTHELDKTREQKEALTRENKKLSDDLHDSKNQISDLTRRLHELEIELRRLENEREELSAAYKEAEAGRKIEEQRAQRLSAEFGQFRHEAERRLVEKDEEIDAIREKSKRKVKVVPPHLPWSNERGLERYNNKIVRAYSETDLRELAESAEEQAKRDLRTFTLSKKSNFSLAKSVSAASVTKKIALIGTVKKKKSTQKSMEDLQSEGTEERFESSAKKFAQEFLTGKSAKAIEAHLLADSLRNESSSTGLDIKSFQRRSAVSTHDSREHERFMEIRRQVKIDEEELAKPLNELKVELQGFNKKTANYYQEKCKQTSIEIEQLNARVVEAETKLKTEVTRIKKKLQIQITELELSLDVANKNNIELQKTIKKQSLQLTEIQAHYDEIQRQLAVTLDQLGIAQRKVQSLTVEIEEIRSNYESVIRAKRTVEVSLEEAQTRINELTTININISSAKTKIEQELATLAGDYDEITRELRVSDERYQRVQSELRHTVELLHEEQERIVKIDAIKKSLEVEVKNLSVRLEEVEANAIIGGKRVISKLEARVRDLELELDEEKRRHAETLKILRKKERTVKEVLIQQEEDQKNISLLQESLDKSVQKINIYKRQLQETEGMSTANVTRVRRFQRELEAAEDRADTAESNLSLIRAKHRTFVTTSSVPGSQVYLVQETRQTTTSENY
ncbi:Paramyosin, short form [Gryllus bimaculatus]|nr:Paramyosin, short form [Gryllus bimaculatus]